MPQVKEVKGLIVAGSATKNHRADTAKVRGGPPSGVNTFALSAFLVSISQFPQRYFAGGLSIS
jgi:hypothetical protein